MARYLGDRSRQTRNAGMDLEHYTKPSAQKCKSDRRPGHADKRRARSSDYGQQLEMKQAIKHYYGLLEKQFKNYYVEADRMKGSTAENLLLLLESRLDNIIYRMGLAATRREARQIVSHNLVCVNGKRCNIPSRLIKIGETVSLVEKALAHDRVKAAIAVAQDQPEISWLDIDYTKCLANVTSPVDTTKLNEMFKVKLVVELYSK